MSMRRLTGINARPYWIAAAVICLLIAIGQHARAEVQPGYISVELVGGEVVGKIHGRGTATVEARVTNHGETALGGIRVRVYYSTEDVFPGAVAYWRYHEFVFEPPLNPGKSTDLKFTDKDAAEYILIEVDAVVGVGETIKPVAPVNATQPEDTAGPAEEEAPPGEPSGEREPAASQDAPTPSEADGSLPPAIQLSYNGQEAGLEYPLEQRGGAYYAASLDFLNLVGGSMSYDEETSEVLLARQGVQLRLSKGELVVQVAGESVELAHPPLEINGRSFIPVFDIAPLFGLEAKLNLVTATIVLSDTGG